MLRSTVLLFILWCAYAKEVAFDDCGSEYDLLSISINECSSEPCNIVIGSTATFTTTFIAGSESNFLYQDIYLRLNGINIALEATPNPCAAGSDTVCPVRAGNFNRYSAVVSFSEDLPPVSGYLFWKLNNNGGSSVVCYRIQVRIVYGSKLVDALLV